MMIELLQGTSVLPGGYEFQAWLVSVGAFAMMLLRMGMWIKGWKTNGSSSNGGKAFLTLSEGEFRGEVRQLLDKQVTLLDKMHDAQAADRARWGPALTQLLTLQQSMAEMLDKHSIMLVEHDKHEREVWQQMLVAMESFQIDTQSARDALMLQMDDMKKELLGVDRKIS